MLDAGLSPVSAWRAAADSRVHPLATRVAVALPASASCARALAEAAEDRDVRCVAAIWEVAERSGAPLGHALRAAAESLRDAAETERDVEVALSGPRATARLISWLPAAGMLLAVASGADLLATVATPAGALAVGVGAALLATGRWWMRAQVRRAAQRPALPGCTQELVAIALGGGMSAEGALSSARSAAHIAGLPRLDERPTRAILELAQRVGAPAAELLVASARQERRSARSESRRAAATLGVGLLLPLGMCVLPSFLLLAVAPLVLGLLSSTVAGLG
jgi:tight adherence protein B